MSGDRQTSQGWSRRRVLQTLAGIVLAGVLLWGMFTRLDVTVGMVVDLLTAIPLWGHLAVVLLTLLIFGFSAFQWMLLLRALQHHTSTAANAAKPASFVSLFFYTTLGAVVGTVIPIQLSMPVVRGALLRWQDDTSLVRGGATSLLEQGIALSVPLLLSVPGILALEDIITDGTWALITAGLVVIGWMGVVWVLPRIARLGVRLFDRMQAANEQSAWRRLAFLKNLLRRLKTVVETNLLQPRLLQTIYALSVVRYMVLMARIMLVMHLLQLDVPLIYAIYIVPAVQLMQLINLTPGNLGMREWTWVGLLALAGVDASTGAAYALAQRVFVTLAVGITGVVVALLFVGWRRFIPADEVSVERAS